VGGIADSGKSAGDFDGHGIIVSSGRAVESHLSKDAKGGGTRKLHE